MPLSLKSIAKKFGSSGDADKPVATQANDTTNLADNEFATIQNFAPAKIMSRSDAMRLCNESLPYMLGPPPRLLNESQMPYMHGPPPRLLNESQMPYMHGPPPFPDGFGSSEVVSNYINMQERMRQNRTLAAGGHEWQRPNPEEERGSKIFASEAGGNMSRPKNFDTGRPPVEGSAWSPPSGNKEPRDRVKALQTNSEKVDK